MTRSKTPHISKPSSEEMWISPTWKSYCDNYEIRCIKCLVQNIAHSRYFVTCGFPLYVFGELGKETEQTQIYVYGLTEPPNQKGV